MIDSGHNGRLLADVLGDGVSAGFREHLLSETLRLARRRRQFRRARRAVSVVAVLASLGLLVWHQFPSGRGPTILPAKPYTLVRTQPLPPAAWVSTRPLSPTSLVASARTKNIVLTADSGVSVRELNDDELLALVPKPAALVRFGPHSAELVFVNLDDRGEQLEY